MSVYTYQHYYESSSNNPKSRSTKPGWLKAYEQHQNVIDSSNADVTLIGDSIIKKFSLYPMVWQKMFGINRFINCGIGGDSTQHVLWRANQINISQFQKAVVIYCGTNNFQKNSAIEIVNGILSIGLCFQKKIPIY